MENHSNSAPRGNGQCILVVDDEQIIRELLDDNLRQAGFHTLLASGGDEALRLLQTESVDVILSDQVMPGMDGLELLRKVRDGHGELPFIMITAHAAVSKAVEAIREGAFDYVQKPVDPDELVLTLQRALGFKRLSSENVKLRERLRDLYGFEGIIAKSDSMMKVLALAAKVARIRSTSVALYGESGTGKEVLAQAIHYAGESMENRFVAINCAAVPEGLLESELFGHRRGAFTGADRDRKGKIEQAAGGTLLLDEIGDMSPDLQAKLLRVLETRTFEPVGSDSTRQADFRLIVATHRDLHERVRTGLFREDLFHRINVFPIHIPPLRERPEDIEPLTTHFLGQLRSALGRTLQGITPEALAVLQHHWWPGNVRELRNCLERAAIVSEGNQIRPEHLVLGGDGVSTSSIIAPARGKVVFSLALEPDEVSLDALINEVLEQTLQRFSNNKSRAAEFLKVNRKMFYRRNKLEDQ